MNSPPFELVAKITLDEFIKDVSEFSSHPGELVAINFLIDNRDYLNYRQALIAVLKSKLVIPFDEYYFEFFLFSAKRALTQNMISNVLENIAAMRYDVQSMTGALEGLRFKLAMHDFFLDPRHPLPGWVLTAMNYFLVSNAKHIGIEDCILILCNLFHYQEMGEATMHLAMDQVMAFAKKRYPEQYHRIENVKNWLEQKLMNIEVSKWSKRFFFCRLHSAAAPTLVDALICYRYFDRIRADEISVEEEDWKVPKNAIFRWNFMFRERKTYGIEETHALVFSLLLSHIFHWGDRSLIEILDVMPGQFSTNDPRTVGRGVRLLLIGENQDALEKFLRKMNPEDAHAVMLPFSRAWSRNLAKMDRVTAYFEESVPMEIEEVVEGDDDDDDEDYEPEKSGENDPLELEEEEEEIESEEETESEYEPSAGEEEPESEYESSGEEEEEKKRKAEELTPVVEELELLPSHKAKYRKTSRDIFDELRTQVRFLSDEEQHEFDLDFLGQEKIDFKRTKAIGAQEILPREARGLFAEDVLIDFEESEMTTEDYEYWKSSPKYFNPTGQISEENLRAYYLKLYRGTGYIKFQGASMIFVEGNTKTSEKFMVILLATAISKFASPLKTDIAKMEKRLSYGGDLDLPFSWKAEVPKKSGHVEFVHFDFTKLRDFGKSLEDEFGKNATYIFSERNQYWDPKFPYSLELSVKGTSNSKIANNKLLQEVRKRFGEKKAKTAGKWTFKYQEQEGERVAVINFTPAMSQTKRVRDHPVTKKSYLLRGPLSKFKWYRYHIICTDNVLDQIKTAVSSINWLSENEFDATDLTRKIYFIEPRKSDLFPDRTVFSSRYNDGKRIKEAGRNTTEAAKDELSYIKKTLFYSLFSRDVYAEIYEKDFGPMIQQQWYVSKLEDERLHLCEYLANLPYDKDLILARNGRALAELAHVVAQRDGVFPSLGGEWSNPMTSLALCDQMFDIIDRIYLDGRITYYLRKTMQWILFRPNRVYKRAAGMASTKVKKGAYIHRIIIGLNIFDEMEPDKVYEANGLLVKTQFEALFVVLCHELVHMIHHISCFYDRSYDPDAGHGPPFVHATAVLFGHSSRYHKISKYYGFSDFEMAEKSLIFDRLKKQKLGGTMTLVDGREIEFTSVDYDAWMKCRLQPSGDVFTKKDIAVTLKLLKSLQYPVSLYE